MTVHEWGVALLCCAIPGDDLTPLTMAQLRTLSQRVSRSGAPNQPLAALQPAHLERLGYASDMAARICALLARDARLERYLDRARSRGIYLLTRLSPDYPLRLHTQLGMDAPPVLFAAGDDALLSRSGVSAVGSRALRPLGRQFAARVGQMAAREGFTLISGNAAGADQTAQEACLQSGGAVIAFVADELTRHCPAAHSGVLMLSAGGFDLPFSNPRALHRNHFIHALGEKTFVAQSSLGSGGTWAGTTQNLRHGWSEVYVCDDGSAAARELCARGATAVQPEALQSIRALTPDQCSFLSPMPT